MYHFVASNPSFCSKQSIILQQTIHRFECAAHLALLIPDVVERAREPVRDDELNLLDCVGDRLIEGAAVAFVLAAAEIVDADQRLGTD